MASFFEYRVASKLSPQAPMASLSSSAPKTHWALLIGIDLYLGEDGKWSKCLKGAVNDVVQVEEYLRPHNIDITRLTATLPPDNHSNTPQESPAYRPTKRNVVASLQHILNQAQPRSHVLVHYSGHGTRRPGEESERNLALVLYSDQTPFSTYLYGPDLGSCLKKMVKKELVVTLILDCCFAGSVQRTSQTIRTIDYSAVVDAASSCDRRRDTGLETRQWLADPDGYLVIAACGPTEKAHERDTTQFDEPAQAKDPRYQGVLSYFLQKALTLLAGSGVRVSHESLCERLRVECQALRLPQMPMRFGNSSSTIYGTTRSSQDQEWPSLYLRDRLLFLNEGAINGVSVGDVYAIFPFGSTEQDSESTPHTVKVLEVSGTTSKVGLIKGVQRTTPASVGTGWKAKPLSSASQRKIDVRISPDACQSLGDAALSQEKMFLRPCTTDDGTTDCEFSVDITQDDHYILLDMSGSPLEGVMMLSRHAPDAAERLMNTLQHLATFEYFKGIDRDMEDCDFDTQYCLKTFVGDKPSDETKSVLVKHGSTWRLEVQNLSKHNLYVALFNFTQSWKIVNIRTPDDEAFRIIEAGRTKSINLPMVVPKDLRGRDRTRCKDVIKVFLTNKATTFPTLILKALSADQRRVDGEVELDRARAVSIFLRQLMFDSRRQDDGGEKPAQWMTRNYTIWTGLEK